MISAIYIPFGVAWFMWSGLMFGAGFTGGWAVHKIYAITRPVPDERRPAYTAQVTIDGQDFPPMVTEGVRWRLDQTLAELLDDKMIRDYTLQVKV